MRKSFLYIGMLFIFITPMHLSADWILDSISWDIDGITRPAALRLLLECSEGDQYTDKDSWDQEISRLEQLLLEQRTLEEVEVSYTSRLVGEDFLVDLRIYVKDSWNLIVLPYYRVDSNVGTKVSLKFRDYNFLGSLNTLSINVDYIFDNVTSNEINHILNVNASYPISFEIMDKPFTLSAQQGYSFLPTDEDDSYYFNTGLDLGTSWRIPWTFLLGREPRYSVNTGLDAKYRFNPETPISEGRDGLIQSFSHGLSLSNISWGDNNYREGLAFTLHQGINYRYDDDSSNKWSGPLYARAEYHGDRYPWGFTSRLSVQYNPFGWAYMGSYLRGILDKDVYGDGGIFLNNALYLTVWNWEKLWEWYGGFTLDMGYLFTVDPDEENFRYALGVEGLCFPHMARSFYARLTLGFDAQAIMDSDAEIKDSLTDNMEFFFGLGAFY